MKTLGVILIVSGILISVLGYGQYVNADCMCPAQIVGQPFNCHCMETLQQNIGHVVLYVGITIVCSGIILFILGWRKRQSLSLSEK